jgi:CTP:molybdopterin cytidylyltransferase MocA
MRLAAVVLAAGRGERLGGPKALLAWPHGGALLPLAAVHVALRPEAERVLVVTREEMALVLGRHAPAQFGPGGRGELLVSRAPDSQGPAGSLAAAAWALAPEAERWDAVMVTPVDCPPVAEATLRELLAALADPEVLASRPRYGDSGGHPVVLRTRLLARYLGREPAPLRDLLRALGPACRDVLTGDPSVLHDVDTPAAWRALARLGDEEAIRFYG